MSQDPTDAILGMCLDEAVTIAQRMLDSGTDPRAIIVDGSKAMDVIGRRSSEGEVFLPELIMVGGAPVDENVRAYTGADGWGNDVGRAVELAAEWTDGGT